MAFRNQQAFDDPRSRMVAMGTDLRSSTAITDAKGQVLAYAQTGGMMSPQRFEIAAGTRLFRFGSRNAGPTRVAMGGWWVDQQAFDRIFAFAQVWDLSIGAAMRFLCLVPPEWSDATLLIRARVAAPLLAWRGLAMSVVTPARGGGPHVKLPHQNDIAARRLHQLYIPGLGEPGAAGALLVEQDYPLDKQASQRGFLYL